MSRDTYWRSVEPDYRNSVALGTIQGTTLVQKLANSLNVPTSPVPFTIWDLNTYHTPPSAAVSLEILSDNANDTSAGTGARTVLIQGLDGSYNQTSTIVTLNGTTPVALPGTWFAVNSTLVLSSGTFNNNNIGNLTVRVAGGGTTHDYLIAAAGIARNSMFTVPAAYTMLITDIYVNVGKPAGAAVSIDFYFQFMMANGSLVKGNVNTFTDSKFVFFPLSTGIPIPAQSVVSFSVSNVSTAGINIDLSYSGLIIKNSNISFGG